MTNNKKALELRKTFMKSKIPYVSTPKKHCDVIIYDLNKPIEIKQYKDTKTNYVHYNCKFFKINDKHIAYGKHTIQLSTKVAYCQLINWLEQKKITDWTNLHLKINKTDNHHFWFNICTEEHYPFNNEQKTVNIEH